jgi:hypothetical protein
MKQDFVGLMIDHYKMKYLNHSEIDYIKWDQCIQGASNSRVYAMSWYLNRVTETWDALIWGDYEFVMPLTIGKKYGIRYLYQPVFSQQLGIFPKPTEEIAFKFFSEIRKKFKYVDIQLNSLNPPPDIPQVSNLSPRCNFLLPLKEDYRFIRDNYSKNTKRNLVRAESKKLNFVSEIILDEHIEFTRKNAQYIISNEDLNKLKSVIAYSRTKGFGGIPGVYNNENNLCATVFFCRWKDRVTYLNGVSDSSGKDLRALFFLFDSYIRTNAGKNIIIDFEGSMIPGVARFFKGFGASPEYYYPFRFNRLPLPFKWLKNT